MPRSAIYSIWVDIFYLLRTTGIFERDPLRAGKVLQPKKV